MIDKKNVRFSDYDDGNDRPGKPKVVVKDPEDEGEKAPVWPSKASKDEEGGDKPGKPKVVVKDTEDDGEKDSGFGSY